MLRVSDGLRGFRGLYGFRDVGAFAKDNKKMLTSMLIGSESARMYGHGIDDADT